MQLPHLSFCFAIRLALKINLVLLLKSLVITHLAFNLVSLVWLSLVFFLIIILFREVRMLSLVYFHTRRFIL